MLHLAKLAPLAPPLFLKNKNGVRHLGPRGLGHFSECLPEEDDRGVGRGETVAVDAAPPPLAQGSVAHRRAAAEQRL